jgi:hypothetical protein
VAELNQAVSYWHKVAGEKVFSAITERIKFLQNQQGYQSKNIQDYMRAYQNMDQVGFATDTYTRTVRKDKISLNIVASIIDTLTAKIAKHKPRPMFLTDGGDLDKQIKAKKLQKFVDGIFYGQKMYDLAPLIFRDGGIWGTGVLKVYEQDDQIKFERVFLDEIKVDDSEGLFQMPRNMVQMKAVPRETLIADFPEFEAQIKMAPRAQSYYSNIINSADHVWAIEAWHLKSGPKTKDGRHVICCETCTLSDDDKWNKDFFPFVFFRNNPRPLGFFGQGTTERINSIQTEINKLLRTAQLAMHLCAVPKVFVENGAKVSIPQLNNEIGGVIKYTGVKPSYEPLSAVPPEIFQQIDRLVRAAYEQEGISMLSAAAEKPAGLNSGKALREYNDIETERFSILAMAYENFFLEAVEHALDVGKDIYERKGSFEVQAKTKGFLETIDWKDIDLKRDQYLMQIFPTSMLSKTPAGRLQDVQEMVQAGFIGKEVGVKLLDFPDLEGVNNMITAAFDDIQDSIDRMIEKGDYNPPEPFQNLQLLIQMTQSSYLRARVNKVPEDRLELLRRYMDEAQSLMQGPQPQPMPQVIQGPQSPVARPELAPQTDMLPFSAGATVPPPGIR